MTTRHSESMEDWSPPETNDLEKALSTFVEETQQTFGHHPGPEELQAYSEGSLEDEAVNSIQSHLVGCVDCQELLLDIDCFDQADFGLTQPISEEQHNATWETLRARLTDSSKPLADSFSPPPPMYLSNPRFAYGLAIGFAFLACTLSLYSWRLHKALNELSSPQLNTAFFELLPSSTREGAKAEEFVIPARSQLFTISFAPPTGEEQASYGVELLDSAGHSYFMGHGLEEQDIGTFSLTLPRDFIPPGETILRLLASHAEEKEVVHEYRFRILYSRLEE